jgi:hypothetical protein
MFGVKVVSRDASNIGVCPNAYIPGTQAYGKNGIHCRAKPRFDGVEVKLATDHGDEIKICQVVTYYYILTHIYVVYILLYQPRNNSPVITIDIQQILLYTLIYSYMLLGFSCVLD